MISTRLIAALAAGLFAGAISAPSNAAWTLADLGAYGGSASMAYGLNNAGQVVGYYVQANGKPYPFITINGQMTPFGSEPGAADAVNDAGQGAGDTLTADQTALAASLIVGNVTTDLGRLGGTFSIPKAINANGQVIGYAHLTSGIDHAFVATPAGTIDLGTLSPATSSYANAINASGQVVGDWFSSSYVTRGFIASGGTVVDIGTLGGTSCFPYAINDAGQVVGISATASGSHAFLYDGRSMTDLGTLGGKTSAGWAINQYGQIAGYSLTASGATHAFIYSGKNMTDLGTLGGTVSAAVAINANGQAIGYSTIANGTKHAFYYGLGQMTDLETAVPGLSNINVNYLYLNDAGQIAGTGLINGSQHAFLLTPVL